MSDGRTSATPSLMGLPLPLTLAVAVAILGLIGLKVPGLTTSPPKGGSASHQEAKVSAIAYDGHSPAIRVLAEAFGMREEGAARDQAKSAGQGAESGSAASTDYAAELTRIIDFEAGGPASLPSASRCLIACLPDPNDSHFPMSFDNGLESIVRGFQKHGYVRDRYEMVWQDDLRLIRAGTQSFDKRVAHDRASAILFRRPSKGVADAKDSHDEFAMLLLVGETPTTGVHQRALHDAMSFVHALQSFESDRAKASNPNIPATAVDSRNPDFRILGPSYSGSSSGLRRTIDQWRAGPSNKTASDRDKSFVRIISGSATATSNAEIFSPNRALKNTTIDYSSTMARDDIVLDAVIHDFVNNRGVKPYQIAILSEADTSYGSELLARSSGDAAQVEPDPSLRKVRRLRYPMTLSRMRDEYSQRGRLGEASLSQPEIIQRRNLDLSLDVSPFSIDILPSFSPSSAAVAELVLESVLSAVHNDDIRVLGILGTDTTDKLFLARQIRKRCPDVQLFTLESDFLFTHATYAPSLRGMIVASSYPLYPRTQSWSLPLDETDHRLIAHTDVQFASDTSQGIYNATIQLLNSPNEKDAADQLRLDFGRVFGAKASNDSLLAKQPPSGWLSMVGDTEIIPLRQLGEPEIPPPNDKLRTLGRQHWVRTPQRLPMALAMLLAVTVGLVFWFWNGSTTREASSGPGLSYWHREFLRSTRLFRLGGWRQSCVEALQRGYFAATFFLGIAMILGAISFAPLVHLAGFGLAKPFAELTQDWEVFARWNLLSYASWNWLVFATWSFVFTVTLSCVLLALLRPPLFDQLMAKCIRQRRHKSGLAKRPTDDEEYRWGRFRIVSCLCASLMLYLFLLAYGWSLISRYRDTSVLPDDQAWFALQISRTANLSNLINPTVPILLLGAIFSIWGYCSLKRLQLVDEYGLSNPLVDLTKTDAAPDPSLEYAGQLAGIRRTSKEIRNSICQVFWKDFHFTDVIAGAVLAIALYRALSSRWVGTYEGAGYDYPVSWLLGIAFVFVAVFIFRVHKLLRSADRMLTRIGYLPLVDAFSRLPESVKSKAAGQLSCLRPDQGDVDGLLRKYDGLREVPEATARGLGWTPQQFEALSADALALLAERRQALVEGTGSGYVFAETRLAQKLAESTERLLVPSLLTHWQGRHDAQQTKRNAIAPESEETDGTDEPPPPQSGEQPVPTDPRTGNWYRDVEELIAMQFTYQIRVIFLHIRNLLVGTTLMILLLFWAVNCYPFQPSTLLNFSCLVLLVWLLTIVFSGILRFNRNEILSRINGTKPNQLTFDSSFWGPIVSYIGLPILAVLATMMPTVGRTLFGWTATFGQMFSGGGS